MLADTNSPIDVTPTVEFSLCINMWNRTDARHYCGKINGAFGWRCVKYTYTYICIALYNDSSLKPVDTQSVVEQFQLADETLSERVLNDDRRAIDSQLPPRTEYSYNLRRRWHDYELTAKTRTLNTNKFIIRMLYKTRMWADAQRDGRSAKCRWRPLFNAAKFG